MPKRPRNARPAASAQPAIDSHLADQIFRTARTAIKTVGWGFSAFMAKESIEAISGQQTAVAIAVTLTALGELKLVIPWVLAAGLCGWAVVERRLRQNVVKRLHPARKAWERYIDPSRTSSGLTPEGNTDPTDQEVAR